MSLLMLCPSRGRPEQASDLLRRFEETIALDDTELRFVVDSDDETADRYPSDCTQVLHPPPGNMNSALNAAALTAEGYDYLGFWGDDHRPRTPGWDELFVNQLAKVGGGMVYGNDLLQGAALPTHIILSAGIVARLGWFGLPDLRHLYLDNTWLSLGDAAGMLYYMPSVVIEHMHPANGKAMWDANYQRVNSQDNYSHDQAIYEAWLKGPQFQLDVATALTGR